MTEKPLIRHESSKFSQQGRMVLCSKCKLPGGLKGLSPLKKVGDVYEHNGPCPRR